MKRVTRVLLSLLSLVGVGLHLPVAAQAYPSKPIRVVIPFAAGSSLDFVARLVGAKVTDALGQALVIDNRAGASGRTGSEQVARAAPDGYTILLGTSSTHVSGTFLVRNMPYDPFTDFTPLTAAVNTMGARVLHPSVPATSMKELLDYARANPGKLAYGSNGIGSSYHLIAELIKLSAGVDMLHVPYQGAGQLINALAGGHIQVGFNSINEARKHVATGALRVLAVPTAQRYRGMPNVPPLAETVPGYEPLDVWFGYFGPARLPETIVKTLNTEIVAALNAPDVLAKPDEVGIQSLAGTPAELTQRMRREMQIYARIFKAAKIEPQ